MMSVLKNVGKGILYIIGLPFFLLILVGTGIAGIFVLVFMFFKSIILFFTGRSLDDELPEDRKARMIKEGGNPNDSLRDEPMVSSQVYEQPKAPQPNNIEEAVFGSNIQQEPIKEEDIEPERTSDEIFDNIFANTTPAQDPEEDYGSVDIQRSEPDDEPIGEYIPHKSTQRIVNNSEPEEEEDHSASNIYFGGDDD